MRRRGRPPHPDVLTPREWEVLALLRQGLSNDEIAQRLEISLAGAKYHVSEILGKLGVESRQEAARWRRERRPWWASAVAPVALLWRRAGSSWLAPAAGIGAAVVVAGGIGLLVWGLLRTSGGEGDSAGVVAPPPGPTATVAFRPIPSVTPGGPADTPFPTPERPSYRTLLLDPTTGDIEQQSEFGTLSPDGRLLVVSSPDYKGLDVLTIATGDRVRVWDGPFAPTSWSPDSSRLAIAVTVAQEDTDVGKGLFVANADGSGYRRIADLGGTPYWSPRGDLIGLAGETIRHVANNVIETDYEVLIVRPDGSPLRTDDDEVLQASPDIPVTQLFWSFSGSHLAFVREDRRPFAEIIMVDVDAGAVRTLTGSTGWIGDVRWAPDEREVAFVAYDPEKLIEGWPHSSAEVHVVPSDGSAPPRRIANGTYPSWSPDGRYLAFVGNWCQPPDVPRFDLMVHDSETDTVTTITPPELDIFWAQFSPTDEQISFAALGQEYSIYTVRPDGSQLQRLFVRDHFIDNFAWISDGGYISLTAPAGGRGICD